MPPAPTRDRNAQALILQHEVQLHHLNRVYNKLRADKLREQKQADLDFDRKQMYLSKLRHEHEELRLRNLSLQRGKDPLIKEKFSRLQAKLEQMKLIKDNISEMNRQMQEYRQAYARDFNKLNTIKRSEKTNAGMTKLIEKAQRKRYITEIEQDSLRKEISAEKIKKKDLREQIRVIFNEREKLRRQFEEYHKQYKDHEDRIRQHVRKCEESLRKELEAVGDVARLKTRIAEKEMDTFENLSSLERAIDESDKGKSFFEIKLALRNDSEKYGNPGSDAKRTDHTSDIHVREQYIKQLQQLTGSSSLNDIEKYFVEEENKVKSLVQHINDMGIKAETKLCEFELLRSDEERILSQIMTQFRWKETESAATRDEITQLNLQSSELTEDIDDRNQSTLATFTKIVSILKQITTDPTASLKLTQYNFKEFLRLLEERVADLQQFYDIIQREMTKFNQSMRLTPMEYIAQQHWDSTEKKLDNDKTILEDVRQFEKLIDGKPKLKDIIFRIASD